MTTLAVPYAYAVGLMLSAAPNKFGVCRPQVASVAEHPPGRWVRGWRLIRRESVAEGRSRVASAEAGLA